MTLIRKLCAGDKCKHKRFLKANRLEREKNIKILNDLVNNDCTTVRECDDLNLAIFGKLENTLNTSRCNYDAALAAIATNRKVTTLLAMSNI